ncbi:beta-N-acetylhexosaminidase [Christiangramia sp.]|uniref:beta-N-acetylhexosaminidase n=1 Tax=Christiangramia sp. TaxID=1931228 RepID=UPI00260960C4|nr:beta-N-acetylhexosaminidase [Christiangramia sp.]
MVSKNYHIALFSIFVLLLHSGFAMQDTTRKSEGSISPAIIPIPQKIEWGAKEYSVPQKNTICYDSNSKESVKWIEKLMNATGKDFSLSNEKNCGNWNLKIDRSLENELGEEGYHLEINASGVSVKSAAEAGLFYGIQTLRQLFPSEIESGEKVSEVNLPFVKITDTPKYSWRGSMLDIARSFLSKEYIKKHIDRMALYKLNRLHLHLTDDQGWRIEIKDYPELAKKGGKSAVKNGRSGFLTQKEYKDLQEYALDRNIVIIPEIDMPGHVYAALTSYPELNCEDNENIDPKRALPPDLYDGYNVGWTRLCLEDPSTYEFVDTIIREMAEITKGRWLHIGGDEIEDPLYEEFIQKADSIVKKYNKTAIGWEESAKADLSDNFIVQRWNGQTEIKEDQKIIDSFCKFFYLDHGNIPDQENTYKWCSAAGVSLETVYSYSTDDSRVIGVEAPVWSELVISDDRADDRLWPRSIAVAEIGWSNDSSRDFKDFVNRLAKHGERMDKLEINYHKSPEVKWRSSSEKGVFTEILSKED